jgi:hypothetical protein
LLCPEVKSLEEVLCQRVVAPCLISSKATEAVVARSGHTESRASRKYPSEIRQWEEFARNVSEYRVQTGAEHVLNRNRYNSIFRESLDRAQWPVRDESGEKYNLFYNLRASLVKCGIVGEVCDGKDGCTGLVDFTLKNGEKQATVMCESKSTNNLLLPLLAEQCVEKYNKAFNKMHGANDTQEGGNDLSAEQYEEKHNEAYVAEDTLEDEADCSADDPMDAQKEGTHPPAWSMVCHPLGQIFGYMLDNKCPFGALTSGSRTYFVSISGYDVKISDAWFVGQKNYLRAWAYVHSLGCVESEWKQPTSWKKLTTTNPTSSPPEGTQQNQENQGTTNDAKPGKRNSNNSSQGSSNAPIADIASLALPIVPYNDIAIGDVIGDGRNGSCFKVVWKSQEFAMKQFDIGKRGEVPYKKEIAAYMRLRDAWGKLVPQPMFLSESPSGGVKFLGLQLGREPNESDDLGEWYQIWQSLKQEYGFRHNDAEGRNMIFIADSVTGVERIVAIDLEDWYDVSKAWSFEKKMKHEEKKSKY